MEVPVSREVIRAVARQKDYMKRLRKNGGARDPLSDQGIALLNGSKDRDVIAKLKLPACSRDDFVSYCPKDAGERKLLVDAKLL